MHTTTAEDIKAHLIKEFDRCKVFIKAALDSNPFSEDALIEINTAMDDYFTKLENFNTDFLADVDIDTCIEKLEDLKGSEPLDTDREGSLLALLSNESIVDAADSIKGYAVVALPGIADAEKLTEFLNKEIYPYNIGGKSAFASGW